MRWYINDLSLQGQFTDRLGFEAVLRELISIRTRLSVLRNGLRTTRTLSDRFVGPDISVRAVLQRTRDVDLRRAVLSWFDRTGPYIEDDRMAERDDYFEYLQLDATETGLGEATRRLKAGDDVTTFSFCGGAVSFEISPLVVLHGLAEQRMGSYSVPNLWHVATLADSALAAVPQVDSWQALVEAARMRFPRLIIGNEIHTNAKLAREPFDAAIRDRSLELMRYLDLYMQGLNENGVETPSAREIVATFFRGDRALFSGESVTNRREFISALTFRDPENPKVDIFAHWHGKISHRHFRMHFEWPVPARAKRLKILYLGPKLTKS